MEKFTVDKNKFFGVKKFLDGLVFYRKEGDKVIVKTPYKSASKILTEL